MKATLEALAALPARLAGEEIHVAFTVVVGIDGQATLWVSDRNGRSHCITAYRNASDDEGRGSAPWSFADLEAAKRYLETLCRHIRWMRHDSLAEAHRAVREKLAQQELSRLQWAVEREAKKREHERQHPHPCQCGKRFKTLRGLRMHISRARWGTHSEAAASIWHDDLLTPRR